MERDVEIVNGVVEDEKNDSMTETEDATLGLKEEEMKQLWKKELHRRLKEHGRDYGCAWKWRTRGWVRDARLFGKYCSS